MLQVPAVMKGKRAAAVATTPQVVKKVKLADGKAPASAPAKTSSQPSAGLFLVLVRALPEPLFDALGICQSLKSPFHCPVRKCRSALGSKKL